MTNATNTAAAYVPPAAKTEITGPDVKSATGRTIWHELGEKAYRFAAGDKVGIEVWNDCGDGGDIKGWRVGTILRIASGTERGMHGTTALALVSAGFGLDESVVTERLIPVRLLRCRKDLNPGYGR